MTNHCHNEKTEACGDNFFFIGCGAYAINMKAAKAWIQPAMKNILGLLKL